MENEPSIQMQCLKYKLLGTSVKKATTQARTAEGLSTV